MDVTKNGVTKSVFVDMIYDLKWNINNKNILFKLFGI